jgi:hypothetical protein
MRALFMPLTSRLAAAFLALDEADKLLSPEFQVVIEELLQVHTMRRFGALVQ